jgi:hypothetical protein
MVSVEMKDWRGNAIEPGSLVVYPGRHASHMWMVEGEVIEIFQDWHWDRFVWALKVQPIRQGVQMRTDKKPVKITALERVTVVGHVRDLEKSNADSK